MRLWSLHPKYLDRQGLTACWREGLLAQAVLLGNTKGYINHPQLERFKQTDDPLSAIATYLRFVTIEAAQRGYMFDASKINTPKLYPKLITVSDGQLAHEWQHLLQKLQTRSPQVYDDMKSMESVEPHPLFTIEPGPIALWEKATDQTYNH